METYVVLFLQRFEIRVYCSLARKKKKKGCTYIHNTHFSCSYPFNRFSHNISQNLAHIEAAEAANANKTLEWLVLFETMHLRCANTDTPIIHMICMYILSYFTSNIKPPTPGRPCCTQHLTSTKSTKSACPSGRTDVCVHALLLSNTPPTY